VIVDVHGHISPPEALRRYPMPPSLGDVEGMIERKLAAGIDMTVVGSPVGAGAMVPVPGVDNYAQPADRLAALHEWLAATCAKHPAHLRAYVYVNPFGDLEAAAETLREEAFVGLIANTSVNGAYLDDERAEPFFAFAAELGVPVLLHPPASPASGQGLHALPLLEQVGRYHDVAAGLACILLAGVLERHPDLRLIGAQGGGGIALLAEKLDLIKPGTSAQLDRLWVDTATPSPLAQHANRRVFGDRVLLGTDSPPLPLRADLDLAAGENAARLFKERVA
jgi:predicted TIM-barrel fold metal-dependent hydrolase